MGSYALYANTTGAGNTAIGHDSSLAITTGGENTSLGINSLRTATTGSFNTGLGGGALQNTTTASYNTAVGYHSQVGASGATNGWYNTSVGAESIRADISWFLLSSIRIGFFSNLNKESSSNESMGSLKYSTRVAR